MVTMVASSSAANDPLNTDKLESASDSVEYDNNDTVETDPEAGNGDIEGGGPPGNDGNGNGDNEEDNDEADDDPSDSKPLAAFSEARDASQSMQQVVKNQLQAVNNMLMKIWESLLSGASALLKNVPATVLIAIISLISTVSATKIRSSRDDQQAERKRNDDAKNRKAEIEGELRKKYADLAAPMLKSTAKLSERLYVLVNAEWDCMEGKDVKKYLAPTYSAYLLAKYLATVQMIKNRSALLDYGFPAADRILGNIVGRLQGVLSANDKTLQEMQKRERFFKPKEGEKPLKAGPLKITPRTQTVLGDLMQRRMWKDKFDFVDKAEDGNLSIGTRSLITFLEFSQILEQSETMQRWFAPLIGEFRKIESGILNPSTPKRRREKLGARIYFIQSALVDLVDFFDPVPHPQYVPLYRRQRLRLGDAQHNEEQRAPKSLSLLFQELANVRDLRVDGDRAERLRLPHGVEVYVSGMLGDNKSKIVREERGECPHSQRVLLALNEMGVPFEAVSIKPDAKPAWYYLLHSENITPTLYFDGEVVEESGHILSYLKSRFPTYKQLASADDLKLAVGTSALTRFHDSFISWCVGDETAKAKVDSELRELEATIQYAQEKKGGPFLGGERFSQEDTAIVPVLNNMVVAGKKIKNWQLPAEYIGLRRYLDEARKTESFMKTRPDDEVIIRGYELKKGNNGVAGRLADMLE